MKWLIFAAMLPPALFVYVYGTLRVRTFIWETFRECSWIHYGTPRHGNNRDRWEPSLGVVLMVVFWPVVWPALLAAWMNHIQANDEPLT